MPTLDEMLEETEEMLRQRKPEPFQHDWPHTVYLDDYEGEEPEGGEAQGEERQAPVPREPQPWDEHVAKARQKMLSELQDATQSAIRARKWLDTMPVPLALPGDVRQDLRAVSEKLRQIYKAISDYGRQDDETDR